jgi:hypothetical protein
MRDTTEIHIDPAGPRPTPQERRVLWRIAFRIVQNEAIVERVRRREDNRLDEE